MKKYNWFVMNADIDDWQIGIKEKTIPSELIIEILEDAKLNNARTVFIDYCLLEESINNCFSTFDNYKDAYDISIPYETLYGMHLRKQPKQTESKVR